MFTPYTNADKNKVILRVPEPTIRLTIRQMLSEFFGTLFLVFLISGSGLAATFTYSDPAVRWALIAVIQGFSIAAVIWFISGISGCQLNPAVSLACIVTGRMGILNGIIYIIFQLAGAMAGAALMKACLPGEYEKNLSATTLNPAVNVARGICFELIATSFLVLVVLGVAVYNEWDPKISRVAPLAIGCAVIAGVGALVPFTGGSMNPARSFGPAVMSGTWSHHYVYWAGPMAGGIIAGLIWRLILSERILLVDRPYTDFQKSTYGTAEK